ncbi:unnamed protein product [Arctia plantaginis]|uniref:Cyclin-like domain-containing protein n=1 Tax=Arctia plantaginis TaxID=874455 RepID=A0A8S1BRW1_ARCPL|nr:unnamed protein product [Arctia plantaginis]
MAGGQEKWYFTKDQLLNSPSRKCGLDADKELAYRQQAANLIQDMGQRLQVSQLCINTAIVYMHRFFAFHSFTQFHRNAIAAAALFLAAKVEEQPRKLEYVIKVAHVCLHRGESVNALTAEQYQEQAQDLVFNENVLLQTLGFDVAIDHPHTHVVRTCHLVKAPKDLAQTSYFMASNSLHLTTMCLQYRPTVVACFCIHLASKWSNWAIPQSNEGRHWFSYVDRSVTTELLERLTAEFLLIFEKCPSRLKRKMMNVKAADGSSPHSLANASGSGVANSPFDKKHPPSSTDEIDKSFDKEYERERRRQPVPGGYVPATTSQPTQPPPQKIDYNLYREKREREERERREEREKRQQAMAAQQRPGASRPPTGTQPPPHHQRPTAQHHHKPHHPWPQHKPHHQKPPHDHRHHRPPIPGTSAPAPAPTSHPPQPQPEIVPQRTRPPSLFSPESAINPTAAAAAAPRRPPSQQPPVQPSQPPPQPSHRLKPEVSSRPPNPAPTPAIPQPVPQEVQRPEQRPPSPHRKRPDPTAAIREMQPPAILSPFSSPPPKEHPKQQRQRVMSNSEPELIPVVKKLDETPGYENVIRDSQRGSSIKTRGPERKPEPPTRPLNGIETDPAQVSNLLKESLAKPAPITVVTERKSPEVKREVPVEPPAPPPVIQPPPPPVEPIAQPAEETNEHRHKKEKKKKDKHKHKDRDKSKEERKKHKKDKDKRRDSPPPQPPPSEQTADGALRITIPKEKLTSPGLKIKIPKERLAAPPPPPQTSSLKIKISRDVLDSSRKRATAPDAGPPPKMPRHNGAPHHPKVGHWNVPPPYRQPLPYFMVQPPPPLYYGMPLDGYYYGMEGYMYPPQHAPVRPARPPRPPPQPPQPPQPPLPAMPPPPVPPPPPE